MGLPHTTTKPPEAVRRFFERKFPKSQGFTFEFYWYTRGGRDRTRIYSAHVLKNGASYYNATQAPLSWYQLVTK